MKNKPPVYDPVRHTTEPPTVIKKPRELCRDLAGAELHAQQIMDFWHSRGYPDVKAWPEGQALGRARNVVSFSVATNLINGLPPSRCGK